MQRPDTLAGSHLHQLPSTSRGDFARSHPVLTYLLLTFAWSWLIWFAAIPLAAQNQLLLMAIVFIGGYGPALGAILTLGLRGGLHIDLSRQRLWLAAAAATVIFGLMAMRYVVGAIPGYDRLPADLELSIPIVVAALLASLVGGWVISSARQPILMFAKRWRRSCRRGCHCAGPCSPCCLFRHSW